MEQETKYTIKDKEIADLIWVDLKKNHFGKVLSSDTLDMKAAYYDTEDLRLRKSEIALRLRKENNSCFTTIKWGRQEGVLGLHQHQEINIPAKEDQEKPDISEFTDKINDKTLSEIVGDEELFVKVETNYTRRKAMLSYKKSIMELAIDEGLILADGKSAPISELEIELYNGNLSDVLELTDNIAKKYELLPEDKSKYRRGIEL